MKTKHRLLGVSLMVVGALSLAACGSSSKGGSGASTSASAKALTGTPVTIGAQATINGANGLPDLGWGIQAAQDYVNNNLNGINGHPLKMDLCGSDGSPEADVSCANGFVSKGDAAVVDALDSTFGSDAPILKAAKVPVVGLISSSAAMDSAAKNDAFYFQGVESQTVAAVIGTIQKLGKKNVDLAMQDTTQAHFFVEKLVKPAAQQLGITFNVQYVNATTADWSVVAAAELRDKPDLVGSLVLDDNSCTNLFQGLRNAGYQGAIYAGSCSSFVQKMGASAAGAIIRPTLWLPPSESHAPNDVKADLSAFDAAMKAAGHAPSARALYAFSTVVTLAALLRADGTSPVTAQVVIQAVSKAKDFHQFAGGPITCDGNQWPNAPVSCSAEAIFFEVQSDGTYKPGVAAGYFPLPKLTQ